MRIFEHEFERVLSNRMAGYNELWQRNCQCRNCDALLIAQLILSGAHDRCRTDTPAGGTDFSLPDLLCAELARKPEAFNIFLFGLAFLFLCL